MNYAPMCPDYNFCSNYPSMCFECSANLCGTASYFKPIENHHETGKEKPVFNNQKFKIFFGTYQNSADIKVNKWIEDNHNITIASYQYRQEGMGDHSICIMYKVK